MNKLMKFISLIGVLTSASLFISCNNSPIESGSGAGLDYFTWTVIDSNFIYPADIYVGDESAVFIAGELNYKIINGIKTEIVDADFHGTHVTGYDQNYVVFSGLRANSDGKLKVYNSGTITDYTPSNYLYDFRNTFVIEANKFLYQSSSFSFSYFNDGTITEYIMPDTSVVQFFSKKDNTVLIISTKYSDSLNVFKFENNQVIKVGVYYSQANALFNLESGPVSLQHTGSLHSTDVNNIVDYFTGNSWATIFSAVFPGYMSFNTLTGSSNNFIVGSITTNAQDFYPIQVWNGTSLSNEKSFPFKRTYLDVQLSNYKNGVVFAHVDTGANRYFVKGKRTRF